MKTQTAEQELVELERSYWQALKDKNLDAATRLTDDPCIVAGAQGVASIDRKAFAGMMQGANWSLEDFEIGDDVQVRLLNDDVAVVAYTVREDLTVDGKPLKLQAADASTWVRRNGHWVCALHTESLSGDPFGRDRKPVK
jgi:hypothetical protein